MSRHIDSTETKVAITALVAVHFLATLWHGQAHAALGVTLSSEQSAFVFGVVVVAPFAAVLLVWMRRVGAGTWIFFLSMFGSFLFGTYHHYVALSPDHVQHLPQGSASAHSAFIASAAVLALAEFSSTLYGALCLTRARATTSKRIEGTR